MKHPLAAFIAASIAACGFVAWRVYAMRHTTVSQYVTVYDPSRSFTGGCSALVGSADAALRDPGVSASSTLSVLVLGDRATAYEPRRLAVYPIPTDTKVIEGRYAGHIRQLALLRNLRTRCEAVAPTLVSPIFLGVRQAIAELHAEGCKAGSKCGLWVVTDLEETTNTAIRKKLEGQNNHVLPDPLDNRGIKVAFCGFADTVGGARAARVAGRAARLQRVWRQLFSVPSLVSFAPYCPDPVTASQGGGQ